VCVSTSPLSSPIKKNVLSQLFAEVVEEDDFFAVIEITSFRVSEYFPSEIQ
jgi:hypothetical protein